MTSVTVTVSVAALTGATLIFVARYIKLKIFNNPSQHRYQTGSHVVISGGSKGIGKSLAIKYAQLGLHVTIIARNQTDLESAKIEIMKHRRKDIQKINAVSLDLVKIKFANNAYSDTSSQQQELIDLILGEHDRCDILINCAGQAITARFDETSQQQFEYMMQVNYFSAVNLTRLLLPVMKMRQVTLSCQNQNNNRLTTNGGAHIVFVSSLCGLLSFFGYSAYSASKFALVGLAESLQFELQPFDIHVTVAFPPDTDTPGFEEEQKTKPHLTVKMSESSKIANPADVASQLISDIQNKRFASVVGLESRAVLALCNSFMPQDSFLQLLAETIVMAPLKLFGYFLVKSWHKLVQEAKTNEINRAKVSMKCSKVGGAAIR